MGTGPRLRTRPSCRAAPDARPGSPRQPAGSAPQGVQDTNGARLCPPVLRGRDAGESRPCPWGIPKSGEGL